VWPLSEFGWLVVASLALRLLLLPLSHTWDAQSWVNVFSELGTSASPIEGVQRPYETMRELSLLTQAAGRHSDYYQYWAYPPLMLYVYWPLAHLFALFGGELRTVFPVQPAFFAPAVPLGLQALIRLPVIVADIASLFLLRALGVRVAELRWYAFNPLVLLVGVWTFDSVMVAFLLLGLVFATRRRWMFAGVALALGTATKFVPLVALPAVLFGIAACEVPPKRRMQLAVSTCLVCGVTFGLLCWPVFDGLLYVLRFHAQRFGAGLSLAQVWITWAQQLPNVDWQPRWQLYASIEFGGLQLPLALLAAAYLLTRARVSIAGAFLVLVLAFLVGSKVVNEPYALAPVALCTVVLAQRPSRALRECRTLLWIVPFAYAIVNTPLWAFFFSLLQNVAPGTTASIPAWADAFRFFRGYPEASVAYAALGMAFCLIAALSMWFVARDNRVARA
jgi:hypothetical protein